MFFVATILLVVFIVSLFLTTFVRKHALSKEILDIPNDRSSHVTPKPRGGGVAIVVTFVPMVFMIWLFGSLSAGFALAVIGTSLMVAGIGLLDDCYSISWKWRLLVHFFAASWALVWIGDLPLLQVFGFVIEPGWFMTIVAVFFLVWLLNLFNFMDGIDGIAGSEAVFVSAAGAFMTWLSGNGDTAMIMLIFSSATMGFLYWNWPPSNIFMGDVGSGFLGAVLGIFAFATNYTDVTLWVWLTLMSVFLVDASLTLFVRIMRGEKWHEPHRSHAYQWSAHKWGHYRVTVAVNLINVFWVFPLAFLAYLYPEYGVVALIASVAPLLVAAYVLGAGRTSSA